MEEETDTSQEVPPRETELPGKVHQIGRTEDSGEGGTVTDNTFGVPRKGATVKKTWGLRRREAL